MSGENGNRMMLPEGTRVRNEPGNVFEITGRDEHADSAGLDYGGYFAVVVDGGEFGGEGTLVYLDDRDFAPGGLTVLPA